MKSHSCEFTARELLRVAGRPLLPLVLAVAALHLSARLDLLPAPRPTLDTDRTILIHQAEAARQSHAAEILLLGDSSCLMDVSARQLGERLSRPTLSLATFSYLDLQTHAAMLREFVKANPGRLRTVVLLMNPESLRRPSADRYYSKMLSDFWAGKDSASMDTSRGQISWALGTDLFQGRILARTLPIPLSGAYGRRYGFNRDLEAWLTREYGSAVDPETQPFTGSTEYRLAPTLERASQSFKAAMPPGAKLFVGLTPLPHGYAGANYPEVRMRLLTQWDKWLNPDGLLEELPPTLPDKSFARTTHLKESAVADYTTRLAEAISARAQ